MIYNYLFSASEEKSDSIIEKYFQEDLNESNIYTGPILKEQEFIKRLPNPIYTYVDDYFIYEITLESSNGKNSKTPFIPPYFGGIVINLGKYTEDTLKTDFPKATLFELEVRKLLWGWEVLKNKLNDIDFKKNDPCLYNEIKGRNIVECVKTKMSLIIS